MLNKLCYSYNRSWSIRSNFSLLLVLSIPKTRISQLSIFQTYLIHSTGSKSLVTHVSYTTKITSHQWIFFKKTKTGTKEAERKTAGEDSRLSTHPTEPEHTSFSPTYNTIWRSCHPVVYMRRSCKLHNSFFSKPIQQCLNASLQQGYACAETRGIHATKATKKETS